MPIFLLLLLSSLTISAELDLTRLIRGVETQHMAKTSEARSKMIIKRDGWSRELRMSMIGEGRDRFLAIIESPPRDKGVSSLKIGDEMWNYMPAIDRVMKIPSSLMGDAWMGSHFTNDDLIKGNKIEELCTLSVPEESETSAIVDAIPRPEAPIVWGRIRYFLDLTREVATKVIYFDEEDLPVREMVFDRFELFENRHIPLRMKMTPLDAEGESTEVLYESLIFNQPIDSSLFSIRSLRRRR